MSKEEIFNTVKEVIVQEINVDESKVTLDASLESDLQADSLDALEVVMSLQEKFDMEISDESAMNFKTVQDIVDYIAEQK